MAESTERAVGTAIEVAIRLGALFFFLALCLMILVPFVGVVIWALIIAIAVNSPFNRFADFCGGRRSFAAGLLVVLTLVVLAIPTALFTETLVSGAQTFAGEISSDGLEVPPPPEWVGSLPVVGKPIHSTWELASQNLEALLEEFLPQLQAISQWLLRAAGSVGGGVLQLLASIVIAGVLLARSEGRHAATERFATRLAGARGPEFARLAESTVQSVVQGIVGVAVIQSVLAGVGFMVAGISGAGLWALLVLVAAVVQVPVLLVMIPPILLAFSSLGPVGAGAFTVWCFSIGLLDNVLKPIFFGRGAQVPTLVIFLGAIGGMLTLGIVGLFLGAVVLALGYELFVAWLNDEGVPGVEAAP